MRRRSRRAGAVPVALLTGLLIGFSATPVCADLGWSEAQYVARVGAAQKSPLTPDQVRFTSRTGADVLVRFENGRSCEEVWFTDRGERSVPPALWKRARAALRGTPVRRVSFQTPRAPAAEIFEVRSAKEVVRVDRRNGAVRRIARCRPDRPCLLMDQILSTELKTDALLAPAVRSMREHAPHE